MHHTHIVSVFDYGEHDGICYYAMQYIAGHGLDEILADVRRLRSNPGQKQATPVEAVPVPNTTGYPAPPRAVHNAAQTEASESSIARHSPLATRHCGAADPLLRTVTHGLLTGRFAKGTGVALDLEGTPPPATEPIGPGMGSMPAMTHDIGFELGRTRAPAPPSTSDEDRNHLDSASVLSSSSMAGQGEDRYHREVAPLGAQVADALAYAHKRGVLHRDIKPSNLLLDAAGNVWVTDFGLAKFEEGEDLSQSQDLVGTMRYMAPERFRGVSDRRCDVYALGATLYELLTLRPVFEGADRLRLIDQVMHEPPALPRQLDQRIPRDLETIILKALAKDPKDRFATADEMRDELRRFLENRPIRSRPIRAREQFWRWCKRNPGLATANIAAATLTTILAIVSTVLAFIYYDRNYRVVQDNLRIQRAEVDTRLQLFGALQDRARAGRFSRQMGQRFGGLDALAKAAAIARDLKLPRERLDPLRDEAIACLALPDLKRHRAGHHASPQGVIATAFDSTMTRYALRFRDGTIRVRRVADDLEIARFQARGDREIFVFCFSPDGRYLATMHVPGDALTVWDIERRTVAVTDPGPSTSAARFSPDSRRIGLLHPDGEIVVYDLATGQPSRRWRVPEPADLAFRADGAQIAVSCNEQKNATCRILEVDTGRVVRSIPLPTGGGVAWSPDGTTLATPCDDLENLPLGRRLRHPEGDPRRPYQWRHRCGFPPRRHTAGQQRLGREAAALGPGPGPALAELDRLVLPSNSAKTDESSFRSRTN